MALRINQQKRQLLSTEEKPAATDPKTDKGIGKFQDVKLDPKLDGAWPPKGRPFLT